MGDKSSLGGGRGGTKQGVTCEMTGVILGTLSWQGRDENWETVPEVVGVSVEPHLGWG